MSTIIKNGLQVCFVNTEQNPVKIERLGIFNYRKTENNSVVFLELCKVFYPHPEAPEHAVVSLLSFMEVENPERVKESAVFCIEAMKDLQNIFPELAHFKGDMVSKKC